MSNGDLLAFPAWLTERKFYAAMAMHGLIASSGIKLTSPEEAPDVALCYADALIKALGDSND